MTLSASIHPGRGRVARLGLVSAMVLVTLNVWSGGPLLALWIGSRVERSGQPSMLAIAVVVLSLGAISFALVHVLAWLERMYSTATGQSSTVRRHVPWLRSMRDERRHGFQDAPRVAPLDVILVSWVVIVFVLFEVWFFFYSSSPIDQRTGRDNAGVTLIDR